MSLEWQFNHIKPPSLEDCVSILCDVAERAKKVIRMQHCSRIVCSLSLDRHAHDLRPSGTPEMLGSVLVEISLCGRAFPRRPPKVGTEVATIAITTGRNPVAIKFKKRNNPHHMSRLSSVCIAFSSLLKLNHANANGDCKRSTKAARV